MVDFATQREEEEHHAAAAVTEEERIQKLKDDLKELNQVIQALQAYAPQYLVAANFDILDGLLVSKWAAQLHQIIDEMLAYRNSPTGNSH